MVAAGEEGIPFEDPEFPPDDSSLYIHGSDKIPGYADEEPRKSKGPHPWLRPEEFAEDPDYFKESGSLSFFGQNGDVLREISARDLRGSK